MHRLRAHIRRSPLSSCGGARSTSHGMLMTRVCGSRAGMRASKRATGIPVCSSLHLAQTSRGGWQPLRKDGCAPVTLPPYLPRGVQAACGIRPVRRRGGADRHHALGPPYMSRMGTAHASSQPGRPPHVQRRALSAGACTWNELSQRQHRACATTPRTRRLQGARTRTPWHST